MSLEALALGLLSGLRPGTSLAALLVLLKTPEPRRPLVFFISAGFVSSWTIGVLVVAVFYGADLAIGGGSTFTAIVDVAFGAAALGFAAGLHRGWVQPPHRREPSSSATGASSRLSRHLRNPSARVSAAAGVGTHLPGLIYLVALNAIASEQPALVDAGVQVAIYNALWFMVPIASLVLVMLRPGAALVYLQAGTAWALRHDHVLLVAGSLALGIYLVVKGTSSLLT